MVLGRYKPNFIDLGLIVAEKSWVVGCREKKKEETVLEAKNAVFDKSSNPNYFEFRLPVFCIVFRRSRSFGNCYKPASEVVGRLHFKGTKIGNYRVGYNSTRSAAPKFGGGAAPAVAVAG